MTNQDFFLGLGGIGIEVFCLVRLLKRQEYQKNGIKTQGVVVELDLEDSRNQTRMYYPVVKFTLEDGAEVTEKYSDGSSPAAFDKGDKVDIIYKRENPSAFLITNGKIRHLDTFFAAVGLFLILYSVYRYLNL